jgi:hypothetical protein
MTLDCPKCGRRNVLSDDDAVFFYPRFQCLSCGARLSIPLTADEYLKRLRDPDRDRRVHADGKTSGPIKAVPKAGSSGDAG